MNFNNIWYFGRATRWRSYQPSSGGWLEKNQDPSFEGWSKNLPWNMWGLSCGMPGRSLCISKGKNQEKKDSFFDVVLKTLKNKQKYVQKVGKRDISSQDNFVSLLICDSNGSVFNVALKSLPQESCFLFETLIKIPRVLMSWRLLPFSCKKSQGT